ncbi:MAG: 5-formyltetrahydrofolate cyclo-ligase [Alistipes sp.]|nr:5-formyltetrahydrofolate cyclo-ligase [Alistipes sp.]
MNKKTIRQSIKRLTAELSSADREAQRDRVIEALRSEINSRKLSVVALFSPLPDEVDISPLVDALAMEEGYRVVLPRVEMTADGSPLMEFYDYQSAEMAEGAYGINEPQGEVPCRVEEIELMVVPGVAFTRDGVRLGRGKGFYDCYLSREGFHAFTIGACYAHQMMESLPYEPHDRRVDCVVCGEK